MSLLLVGGSKGIGNAILQKTIEETSVVNFSRTAPELNHPNLIHYSLDILKDELPDLNNINQIVYCPGSITLKPINSLKIDDFRNDYEINVIGAVRVIKKYLKDLKRADNPSITLFSTVAVFQGMPFHSSIAAAKAGVEGLTKSLAAELAPHIRVNAIAPSITDTPLASGILRNEKSRENLANKHPLKRILSSEDIAATAKFLMSKEASSITGQIFNVDAGLSTLKI
ncbi:MAG: SDR family oxidoreductase [Bacteroidota bacterium]